MLDEKLKIRDESKNVIASIAKQSIIILFAATFFSACTDYQEEFENAFGALEYVVESSSSTPESSDGKTATKEKSSSSVKNLSATSSSASASSGTAPMSSETVPTQSSAKSSSSAKLSSSSAASSSSAKLSSSAESSSSAKSSSSSIAPLSSYNPPAGDYGEIEYKGQKYRTVTIGDQEWMAENLNFEVSGSSCYKDSTKYCDMRGRLYSWKAATTACPEGWRLPDSTDWAVLFKSVGTDAATHLKATSGWDSNANGNGDDAVGFSVFPAGGGSMSGDVLYYSSLTSGAVFWTNEKISDTEAWSVNIYWKNKDPEFIEGNINDRRSVRCIKGAGLLSSSSAKSSSSVQSSSSAKSSSSVVSSSSITISSSSVGKVKDRAGNEYPVVQIGEQYWMAENLNYKTEGSACYDDQESNCELYGRLYTWEAAMTACPDGYRLPSQEDYSVLWNYANQMNGGSRPQDVLWVKGHWDTHANNKTGFSAYPGGRWNGSYDQWGREALFWTSTEVNDNKYAFYLMMDDANATVGPSWPKNYRLSVRCVKD